MPTWEATSPYVVFGVLFLDLLAIVILSRLKKVYAAELERLKGSRSIWVTVAELLAPLGTLLLIYNFSNSAMVAIVVGLFALMNAAIIVSFYDIYRAKKLSVKA